MEQKQRDILLIVAMVLGLVSIPMVWASVPVNIVLGNLALPGGFPVPGNQGVFPGSGGLQVNVTGLTGSFPFLLGTPFWLISLLAVLGSLILLLSSRNLVQISQNAEWGIVLSPAVLVLIGLIALSTSASPRIGVLLAVASALLPIYYLWKKSVAETTSDEIKVSV